MDISADWQQKNARDIVAILSRLEAPALRPVAPPPPPPPVLSASELSSVRRELGAVREGLRREFSELRSRRDHRVPAEVAELRREVAALKEFFQAQLRALREESSPPQLPEDVERRKLAAELQALRDEIRALRAQRIEAPATPAARSFEPAPRLRPEPPRGSDEFARMRAFIEGVGS